MSNKVIYLFPQQWLENIEAARLLASDLEKLVQRYRRYELAAVIAEGARRQAVAFAEGDAEEIEHYCRVASFSGWDRQNMGVGGR